MIKTLIVDDEGKSRNTLATMLSRYCSGITVAAAAANMHDGLEAIAAEAPELVFLDVSMPGGSGFDLLEQLSFIPFEIIFTTAYNEYALQAIKASAVDYLLKPLNIQELQQAVQKATVRITEKRQLQQAQRLLRQDERKITDRIAIPVGNGLQFVPLQQIVRLSAKGSYTEIYMAGTHILSSKPLKDYEDILPPGSFFRAHHSHIINLAYISHYHRGDGGYVTMQDGSVIDISRRKKKEFLGLFSWRE